MTGGVTVLATGPLTTVQDEGRPGLAALGIGRSGACDRSSYRLANRLLGNPAGTAALEVTFGGLALRPERDLLVVTTGARCAGSFAHNAPAHLAAGAALRLGPPAAGLRTYVAIRGGIDADVVLGSRSTDILAGLGPPVISTGDVLPVGTDQLPMPGVDVAPVAETESGEVTVSVLAGPRLDWFTPPTWTTLTGRPYTVTNDSNRIGLRLDGAPLERAVPGELRSEGMVRGALQVPPSGRPVLFLADHPVTGGYPVVGYVRDEDVDRCAQLVPGQRIRFRSVG
jgi:biotin-dependent carboxylase-like uncharacterized protein